MYDYKKQYIDWLTANIEQNKINDNTYRITLPFLDRHNDMIDIYIVDHNGKYELSDDGNTINDLELSGVSLKNGRRKVLLNEILNSYGIKLGDGNALISDASTDNLPLKKHMLSQCILKIDDMFYMSKHNVQSVFIDDVRKFLDDNNVRYVPGASFTGKSGYPTMYDFTIAKYKNNPERNIKVVNHLTNENAKSIIFGWIDTRDARKVVSQLYTFINDEKKAPQDALNALKEYQINPVLWSEKNNYLSELTA